MLLFSLTLLPFSDRIEKCSEIVFFVSFLTDDGETREYRVTKEIYERCEIYQTGDLVTYDGIFFDFGEGEEFKE